jgi:hypothetical protein
MTWIQRHDAAHVLMHRWLKERTSLEIEVIASNIAVQLIGRIFTLQGAALVLQSDCGEINVSLLGCDYRIVPNIMWFNEEKSHLPENFVGGVQIVTDAGGSCTLLAHQGEPTFMSQNDHS